MKVVPKNKQPIEYLPLHLPMHKLIPVLMEKHGLKKVTSDGQEIKYFLKVEKNSRIITNTETLHLAEVQDNMNVLLIDPAQGDNPPKVFICHANEDAPRAKRLYQQLEDYCIIPWLDITDIEVGDNWDKRIQSAIYKEIDYFIILLSSELIKKYEGYVYFEIRNALRRQKFFRPGFRFIIPVNIDNCKQLDFLKQIHTINLSGKGSLKRLVDTIKQDYQNRHGDVRLNRN